MPFDSDEASLVRVTRRDYDQNRKLPPELVAEIARASSAPRPFWVQARREANFSIFAPYLERNVELNRRPADARGLPPRPYDPLLNPSEPVFTPDPLQTLLFPPHC